jgi:hypothetical protein
MLASELSAYRAAQQPRRDQRLRDALEFNNRYGAIFVNSPELVDAFANFVSRGIARKEGMVFVNTTEAWECERRAQLAKTRDEYWAQGGQLFRPDNYCKPAQPPTTTHKSMFREETETHADRAFPTPVSLSWQIVS